MKVEASRRRRPTKESTVRSTGLYKHSGLITGTSRAGTVAGGTFVHAEVDCGWWEKALRAPAPRQAVGITILRALRDCGAPLRHLGVASSPRPHQAARCCCLSLLPPQPLTDVCLPHMRLIISRPRAVSLPAAFISRSSSPMSIAPRWTTVGSEPVGSCAACRASSIPRPARRPSTYTHIHIRVGVSHCLGSWCVFRSFT